jgi:hypothetical protein
MKKKEASQTSVTTHPVHATEANAKRAKIITTPYTVTDCSITAILADSSGAKASLIEQRGAIIVEGRICGFVEKLRRGRLL